MFKSKPIDKTNVIENGDILSFRENITVYEGKVITIHINGEVIVEITKKGRFGILNVGDTTWVYPTLKNYSILKKHENC